MFIITENHYQDKLICQSFIPTVFSVANMIFPLLKRLGILFCFLYI